MPNGISGRHPRVIAALGQPYRNNAYQMTRASGSTRWFNCKGCHADGGGDLGPALMDGWWRYGPDPVSIFASIRDGRPHGMPAFGDKPDDGADLAAHRLRPDDRGHFGQHGCAGPERRRCSRALPRTARLRHERPLDAAPADKERPDPATPAPLWHCRCSAAAVPAGNRCSIRAGRAAQELHSLIWLFTIVCGVIWAL